MPYRLILAAGALAFSLLLVAQAEAQPRCGGGYTDLAAHLFNKYGEEVVESAPTPRGNVRELWSNPDTGSWTMLVRSPDGTVVCVVGSVGPRNAKPEPSRFAPTPDDELI